MLLWRDVFHFDGHGLVLEPALVLRAKGVLMTAQREGIGILAGYVILLLEALGGQPHAHIDLGPVIHEPRVRRRLETSGRSHAHRLASARDDDVGRPGAYAIRCQSDSLQARAAKTIDGHGGDR